LLADRLVISKFEPVSPQALAGLAVRLAEINPHAEVARAPRGVAHADWFGHAPGATGKVVPASSLRAAHDESIESFVLQWEGAQPLAVIGAWLQGLSETQGARLLRIKGIVAAEAVEGAVAVHAVGHLVAAPEFLAVQVSGGRMVFITRGLEPGDVAPPWPFAVAHVPAARRAPAMPTPPRPPAAGASCA
jgi:G3E family GTPase